MEKVDFPIIDRIKTGKRLTLLMKINGISPTEVQKYLNLSCVQTVYRWLSGINVPSVDHLYALSEFFGVSMGVLLVGNGNDKKENRVRKWRNIAVSRMLLYHDKVVDWIV